MKCLPVIGTARTGHVRDGYEAGGLAAGHEVEIFAPLKSCRIGALRPINLVWAYASGDRAQCCESVPRMSCFWREPEFRSWRVADPSHAGAAIREVSCRGIHIPYLITYEHYKLIK